MSTLGPEDARRLREAEGWLARGEIARAAAVMRGLTVAADGHPEASLTAARVLAAQGRAATARQVLEAAIAGAPRRADLWDALGDVSFDVPGESLRAYQAAAALAVAPAEYWLKRALALLDLQRLDLAQAAVDRLKLLVPRDARALVAEGLINFQRGALPAAIEHYRAALRMAPSDPIARHNLASALRASDRPDDALAAIGRDAAAPVTETLRAHLLAELGRFDEAIESYRRALSEDAGHLDAHETLTRLLPQLGRGAEALASYRAALATRRWDRALWCSAIASAKDMKDGPQLLAWSEEAASIFGEDLFFALARVAGGAMCGDRAGSIARLRALIRAHPEEAALRLNLAPLLIADGAWDEAETHLLHASGLAPLEQSIWSYLTIVWRLTGDAREAWLADYDRLVLSADLPFDDAALERLTRVLADMHVTRHHPVEHSPRGGTQTRGILFDRRAPEIVELAAAIRQAAEEKLATLPVDATHPFLSRSTGRIAFAGSWSVRLASAGRHASHIHNAGWLSSACYIDLPPEVATPAFVAGTVPPGALLFGVPDESLGLSLTPRRVVAPERGRLVVFPSYFWHGTSPFESRHHRLTVAFDALPAAV